MKKYCLSALLMATLLQIPVFAEQPRWEYAHYERTYCFRDCLDEEKGFKYSWRTGATAVKDEEFVSLMAGAGIDVKGDGSMDQIMNYFGDQGWELVTEFSAQHGFQGQSGFTMKRHKPVSE